MDGYSISLWARSVNNWRITVFLKKKLKYVYEIRVNHASTRKIYSDDVRLTKSYFGYEKQQRMNVGYGRKISGRQIFRQKWNPSRIMKSFKGKILGRRKCVERRRTSNQKSISTRIINLVSQKWRLVEQHSSGNLSFYLFFVKASHKKWRIAITSKSANNALKAFFKMFEKKWKANVVVSKWCRTARQQSTGGDGVGWWLGLQHSFCRMLPNASFSDNRFDELGMEKQWMTNDEGGPLRGLSVERQLFSACKAGYFLV